MIDIKQNTTEQAILVSVRTKNISRETAEEYLAELQELAKTAGAETALTIMQDRMGIDRAYYIGKGKAEEIAQYVEDNEINLIIFDDDLSPMQVRNLETLINRKIVDRSGLILDIFASRAQTKEAKTQVE
ncbi:partial GTPase HflX, partial [Candidatus Brocadiaceae bacterium]